ncbi:MAG TPA: hypothetical protein VGP72_15535 [Planctomycetota bacterium]|jgi:hypothetical protein
MKTHSLVIAAALLMFWCAPLLAEDAGGTVAGVVASKGESWLGVKAEGQDEPTLYMPYWKGGAPKDGGGFDKDIVAQLKSIAVGSKVKLVFKTDEHPRIVSVEVTAPPEKKAETEVASAEKHHGDGPPPPPRDVADRKDARHHGDKGAELLEGNAGTLVGTVSALDNPKERDEKIVRWIEVTPSKGTDAVRFMPAWHGGLPKDGGGPDKEILKTFSKLKVGDFVRIQWTKDDHNRAIKIDSDRR